MLSQLRRILIMTESEHETCKSLAEQLGKPYTAMSIGKLRAAVCSEEDLQGKYILPTGVLKITAQIKGEIDVIEAAAPAIVTVRVLHHQTGNPRFVKSVCQCLSATRTSSITSASDSRSIK